MPQPKEPFQGKFGLSEASTKACEDFHKSLSMTWQILTSERTGVTKRLVLGGPLQLGTFRNQLRFFNAPNCVAHPIPLLTLHIALCNTTEV